MQSKRVKFRFKIFGVEVKILGHGILIKTPRYARAVTLFMYKDKPFSYPMVSTNFGLNYTKTQRSLKGFYGR